MPMILAIWGIVIIYHPTPPILDKPLQSCFCADVMPPKARDEDVWQNRYCEIPASLWHVVTLDSSVFLALPNDFETHLNLYAPLRFPLLPSIVLLFCFHCSIYDLVLMDWAKLPKYKATAYEIAMKVCNCFTLIFKGRPRVYFTWFYRPSARVYHFILFSMQSILILIWKMSILWCFCQIKTRGYKMHNVCWLYTLI